MPSSLSQRRCPTPSKPKTQTPMWIALLGLVTVQSWTTRAFTSTVTTTTTKQAAIPIIDRHAKKRHYNGESQLFSRLRTNVEIPLLDLIDMDISDEPSKKPSASADEEASAETEFIIPLPSSDLPDQLATPFLYGMQMDTPLHKMILEQAIEMASSQAIQSSPSSSVSPSTPFSEIPRPFYGHLVWKDKSRDSLVGAIGCTAEVLVNAPTMDVIGAASKDGDILDNLEKAYSASKGDDDNDAPEEPVPKITPGTNMVLCRGGWRFVVKEIVRSIPFPVAIVDEIRDDADVDDSDMFSTFDEDDDEDDEFAHMETPELIHNTMRNVQSIIGQKLEDARAKTNLSPLEKSILEEAQGGKSENAINPAEIELALAEELAAVWEVFQSSLVDDIEPSQRRFAVAIMAAELANVKNSIRQDILLTRDSEERLKIVLKELKEIVGMAQARKLASSITDKTDEMDKDLKVGKPQLPPWAKQIRKGTKVEYFWNEEWGWCPGTVVEDPVTIVDELLITLRFDADGEEHKLPLSGEDKLRWRPAS